MYTFYAIAISPRAMAHLRYILVVMFPPESNCSSCMALIPQDSAQVGFQGSQGGRPLDPPRGLRVPERKSCADGPPCQYGFHYPGLRTGGISKIPRGSVDPLQVLKVPERESCADGPPCQYGFASLGLRTGGSLPSTGRGRGGGGLVEPELDEID